MSKFDSSAVTASYTPLVSCSELATEPCAIEGIPSLAQGTDDAFSPALDCSLPLTGEQPSTLKLFSSAPLSDAWEARMESLERRIPTLQGDALTTAVVQLSELEDLQQQFSILKAQIKRSEVQPLIDEAQSTLYESITSNSDNLREEGTAKLAKLQAYAKAEAAMLALVGSLREEYPKESSIPFHLDYSQDNALIGAILNPEDPRYGSQQFSDLEPSADYLGELPIVVAAKLMATSDDPADVAAHAFLNDLLHEIRGDARILMEGHDTRLVQDRSWGEQGFDFESLDDLTSHYQEVVASPHLDRIRDQIVEAKEKADFESIQKNELTWLQADHAVALDELAAMYGVFYRLETDQKAFLAQISPNQLKETCAAVIKSQIKFLERLDASTLAPEIAGLKDKLADLEATDLNPPVDPRPALQEAVRDIAIGQNRRIQLGLQRQIFLVKKLCCDLDQPVPDDAIWTRSLAAIDPEAPLGEIQTIYGDITSGLRITLIAASCAAKIKAYKESDDPKAKNTATLYEDVLPGLSSRDEKVRTRALLTFQRLERSRIHEDIAAEQSRMMPFKLVSQIILVLIAAELGGIVVAAAAPFLEGVEGGSLIAQGLNVTAFTAAHETLDAAVFGSEDTLGGRLHARAKIFSDNPSLFATKVGINGIMMATAGLGASKSGEIAERLGVTSHTHLSMIRTGGELVGLSASPSEASFSKIEHGVFEISDLTLNPEELVTNMAFIKGMRLSHAAGISGPFRWTSESVALRSHQLRNARDPEQRAAAELSKRNAQNQIAQERRAAKTKAILFGRDGFRALLRETGNKNILTYTPSDLPRIRHLMKGLPGNWTMTSLKNGYVRVEGPDGQSLHFTPSRPSYSNAAQKIHYNKQESWRP